MNKTNPSTIVTYTREKPLDDKRPMSPFGRVTLPNYQNVEISPLNILQRIFPKNIDDYYMNLAKLYFEFAKQSREFHQNQEYTDKLNGRINFSEQHERTDPTPMVEAAKIMIKYLEEVVKTERIGTIESTKEFDAALDLFLETGRVYLEESEIIDDAIKRATKYDEESKSAAEKLDTLAKEMRDELQYRPPEERLTNIRVRSEHHETLDQFTADYPRDYNSDSKIRSDILKRLFDCYKRLRVTTDNEMDRAVRQVIEDFYINYNVTDFSRDSENYKSEMLLYFNLDKITFLFGEFVKRFQLTAHETDVQLVTIIIWIIDFINDYYSGKEIDPIDLERLDVVIKNNLSFGGLYRDDIIFSEQTQYQKLVMTKHKDDTRLFIDGNLQFSSIDE